MCPGISLNWLSGSFLSFNQYCLDLTQVQSQPDALLQEPLSSRQCNIFVMGLVASVENEIHSWVSSAKPVAAQPLSKKSSGSIEKGCRGRIYSPMVRLQVQDIGKEKRFYRCWFWVLLKPCFVSAGYTILGYIHLAFKE